MAFLERVFLLSLFVGQYFYAQGLVIEEPSTLVYRHAVSNIGPEISCVNGYQDDPIDSISAELVLPAGDEFLCEPGAEGEFNNSIAVISRGNCSFLEKIENAEEAGALAVIIYNNREGQGSRLLSMHTTEDNNVDIPSVFISFNSGEALLAVFDNTTDPVLGVLNSTGSVCLGEYRFYYSYPFYFTLFAAILALMVLMLLACSCCSSHQEEHEDEELVERYYTSDVPAKVKAVAPSSGPETDGQSPTYVV